jgi:hypothetical protein
MMHFYWSRDDLIIVALKAVHSSCEVEQTIFQYEEIIVKDSEIASPYMGGCLTVCGRVGAVTTNGLGWTSSP